jgi:agmatine/peptidylarginine deiminase
MGPDLEQKVMTRFFPPEWAEQSAVLIAWPSGQGDFARWFGDVEKTYIRIAQAISRRQHLVVACRDDAHRQSIRERIGRCGIDGGRIHFVAVPYDDIWVRDTAPLAVTTPDGPLLLDFRFNAWGGKYACDHDAALAENLWRSGLFGATAREAVDFVLEAGSIETDGQGTLLTTRHCLLNPNRNPGLSARQIEEVLHQSFGIRRILWLHHGKAEGDDTDAHVDTLARFCDARTIAYTTCEQESDPQYADLKAMEAELEAFRTASGGHYRLVPLPIPKPIASEDGGHLPATYANFLIINDALLVPVYGDPNDAPALQRLAECLPDREVVPIDCRSLIRQFGSLHCMTMQFPAAIPITAP